MTLKAARLRASSSLALVLGLSVLVGACTGSDSGESAAPPPESPTSPSPSEPPTSPPPSTLPPSGEPLEPGELKAPPPVTVTYSNQSIDLHAWTYCYKNGCADGAPPNKPHDVGSVDNVLVAFPLPDWTFSASFSPSEEKCGRIQQVPLERTGDGQFVLRPAGYADTYDVTLFGRGNGDLFTTFRWTTPADGPLPKPVARLAVLAGDDGNVSSYGVELDVSNLKQTPRTSKAIITVVANNGRSLTFEAKRAVGRCFPEGSLYWDRPDDQGLAAAELGGGPFTYKVELVLDGVRHFAKASWPSDQIPGNQPSVRLDFRPPLPALS